MSKISELSEKYMRLRFRAEKARKKRHAILIKERMWERRHDHDPEEPPVTRGYPEEATKYHKEFLKYSDNGRWIKQKIFRLLREEDQKGE